MSVGAELLKQTWKSRNIEWLCIQLQYTLGKDSLCRLVWPDHSETVIIPQWQWDGLKWHCLYRSIWWLVGSVSGTATLRPSKAQMKVLRAPARLSFFSLPLSLSHRLSVSLCLFVPLSLCLSPFHYQSIWSPELREILTDPLEELRDSISRQQNSIVVLGNSAALDRWALKEE